MSTMVSVGFLCLCGDLTLRVAPQFPAATLTPPFRCSIISSFETAKHPHCIQYSMPHSATSLISQSCLRPSRSYLLAYGDRSTCEVFDPAKVRLGETEEGIRISPVLLISLAHATHCSNWLIGRKRQPASRRDLVWTTSGKLGPMQECDHCISRVVLVFPKMGSVMLTSFSSDVVCRSKTVISFSPR